MLCPPVLDIYKSVTHPLPIKLSLVIQDNSFRQSVIFWILSSLPCASEKAPPLSGIFRSVHLHDSFIVQWQQLNGLCCVRFLLSSIPFIFLDFSLSLLSYFLFLSIAYLCFLSSANIHRLSSLSKVQGLVTAAAEWEEPKHQPWGSGSPVRGGCGAWTRLCESTRPWELQ